MKHSLNVKCRGENHAYQSKRSKWANERGRNRVYEAQLVGESCLGLVIGFQEVEFGNLYIRVGLLDVGHYRQKFMKQVYQSGIELFP